MRKTIYSTIHPTLKNKLLVRGTFFGVLGASILVASSLFASEQFLTKWGIAIFALGIGLIALGMIPLRKIQRIETIPHTLSLTESKLIFEKPGRAPLYLSLNDILRAQFLNRGDLYGVEVITSTLNTFFFPYFSEASANTVSEYIMHRDETDE